MPGSSPKASHRPLVVAIDGPSGSGKSTVSRLVAGRLGLEYLDTGAMYRAVCWACLEGGVDLTVDAAVAAVARGLELELGTDPEAPFVRVGGQPVDGEIREPMSLGAERPAGVTSASNRSGGTGKGIQRIGLGTSYSTSKKRPAGRR